jgi:pyruvate formate lyase activating enzyme
VRILGLQGVSLIDFPGRIASVLFLGGCNFRCPFCQNPDLVLRPDTLPSIAPAQALERILRRRGFVDGVVVTGGEPLINGPELLDLLAMCHDAGLAVKLDTNGYEVDRLRTVLASGLVAYVAMDLKTTPERYGEAAGRPLEPHHIREAVGIIAASGIDHEFRTTCVPGLVTEADVLAIGSLVGPHSRYVLQQYRVTSPLIDPSWSDVAPYPPDVVRSLADAVRPLVGEVAVRGV